MADSGQSAAATAEITRQKQAIQSLAARGDMHAARDLGIALCTAAPRDPEAWFLLGAVHGQLEDFPAAEQCCRTALELAPDNPMLLYNLAVALLKQDRHGDALLPLEQTIRLQPSFAGAHLELGNARMMHKQPGLAAESYRRALELDPGSHIAAWSLGNALHDSGDHTGALENYQRSVNLAPHFAPGWLAAAGLLIAQYRYAHAIQLLEAALRQLPAAVDLYLKLALAHEEQGEADTALEYYGKALALEPDNIDARTGSAAIRGLQGDFSAACEILQQIIAAHPRQYTAIIAWAHFAHRTGAADQAIELVTRTLQDPDIPDSTRSKLHFALAQLYDRKDLIEPAFEHFRSGNRLRGAVFDHAAWRGMFDAIIHTCSETAMRRFAHSRNASAEPVFIVGMMRSGTSLAEQILASHPDVYGAGELNLINSIVDSLPQVLSADRPYPYCLERLSVDAADRLAQQYLDSVRKKSAGAARITDKMPVNFMHLGLIELLFPSARIIHCVRDPLDTCLSCYFRNFSGAHPYAYALQDLGRYYLLYQSLMAHWEKTCRLPMHTLVYEELVHHQERETRSLLEFCGLPWDERCLSFHDTSRTVSTASFDQVRQPLYSRSIGRWRAYEQYLEPLITALQAPGRAMSP